MIPRARSRTRRSPRNIIFSFVCQRNYSRTCILSAGDRTERKNEQKSHFRMTAKKKRQNRNLHKLITFTVVTCEAQWRKVIFTTINLTTFTDDHGWGRRERLRQFRCPRQKPKTWETQKKFRIKKHCFSFDPDEEKINLTRFFFVLLRKGFLNFPFVLPYRTITWKRH